MVTRTENTAAEPVMLRQDKADRYAPVNLMLYRTSLSLFRDLVDDDVFTQQDYRKIRTILNKKYGFPSGSIFAESA